MILLPQRIGFKDDLLPKKEQRGCVCGLLGKFWINTLIDCYFDGVYQPSQRIGFFNRLALIQKTPSRPRFKPEKVISSVAKWLCPKTSDLDIQKPGWWFGTWFLLFHSVGNVIIPTDFHSSTNHIFQRGWSTTKQKTVDDCCWVNRLDGYKLMLKSFLGRAQPPTSDLSIIPMD